MNLIDKLYNAGKDLAAKVGGGGGRVIASLIGIAAEDLENMLTALSQPSLCYIPIKSESLTMRRSVDVGTTMLIAGANNLKEYVTDNAAPRPRTWTGGGYITSLAAHVENGFLIKPTIQVQMAVLDAAADSRQPVKFKTDLGEIVDVLIQDLQISATTKGAGVRHIQYTVQEVKVLENSIMTGVSSALDKAGLASIPKRAITNLGKGSAIGSGTANIAAGLFRM